MAKRGIQAGDKVSFLNETGGGVVLRMLSHNRAVVRTDEGFEIEFALGLLVPAAKGADSVVYQLSDQQVKSVIANDVMGDRIDRDRKKSGSLRKAKQGDRRADDSVMEIDLHLHEITDDERHLSDGEKLDYQIRYFERMLNTAIRERKRALIVIHGVGEGKLRDEVRNVLGYYDGVRFDDADPRRYGYGATEVTILRH